MIENTIVQKSQVLYGSIPTFKKTAPIGKKALRSEEVDVSFVTIDAIAFNTDEPSMDRLDRVITVAGWKFNQALASGMSAVEAYSAVYSMAIGWKSYDNAFVSVTVEQLCRVQEAALTKLNEIWVKWG